MGVILNLNKLEFPSLMIFVPSLVEIEAAVLGKKIFKFRQYIFVIS